MDYSLFKKDKLTDKDSVTYIVSDIKALSTLQLSSDEREYAESKFKEKKEESATVITINRLKSYIGILFIGEESCSNHYIEKVRRCGASFYNSANKEGFTQFAVQNLVEKKEFSLAFVEGVLLSAYSFDKYKSEKKEKSALKIGVIDKSVFDNDLKELSNLIESVYLTRDLVNEPLGYLTAEKFGEIVKEKSLEHNFSAEVFNREKIEALRMNGLLSVNRGSIDPPTFSVMEWKPDNAVNSKPVVLVGKGVMFDTGGLNLKTPAGSMDTMKCDMGGAAAVLGAIVAAASNKLPVHVVGLVPATDNRPGQKAFVPGDIIKMYNGKTVEVINTDAEGRLILADALSFASSYDPMVVIDLATLTGNAAIAIGIHGIVGMGTAGNNFKNAVEVSGDNVCERVVWFPFWEDYDDSVKSKIADIKNLGEREGGAISAGKFLGHFTDKPWIHLDIAGPAFLPSNVGYRPAGGSGVGVRLLFNYLASLSQ
ncbi:leucyl aminopeptidase [Marinilabiliaceae bacterium ANBcel2]|nr:leucyl aminopeptidase [Marinilabiliaceae bacterium ANBcel2]